MALLPWEAFDPAWRDCLVGLWSLIAIVDETRDWLEVLRLMRLGLRWRRWPRFSVRGEIAHRFFEGFRGVAHSYA